MNYFRIAIFGWFSLRRLADFYCGIWPKTASELDCNYVYKMDYQRDFRGFRLVNQSTPNE